MFKLRQIVICTSIIFFVSCKSDLSHEEQIKKYNYFISNADSLNVVGKYKDAIALSDSAIKITDTLSKSFHVKGIASSNLGMLDVAEDNFTEVINLEGDKSTAYKERALVFLKTNNSDCLDDIDHYLENYPNDQDAHLIRRNYTEKNGKLKDAIIEYSLSINKDKYNLDLYKIRGNIYYENGDYAEALADYKTVLQTKLNDVEVLSKKLEVENIITKIENRNNLIYLMICVYILYFLISSLILKPIATKKANTQIGGQIELEMDPFIVLIPLILIVTFVVMFYYELIPTLKLF